MSVLHFFQVSTLDWVRAEKTYHLCEVLFKVHKVSLSILCTPRVSMLTAGPLWLKRERDLPLQNSRMTCTYRLSHHRPSKLHTRTSWRRSQVCFMSALHYFILAFLYLQLVCMAFHTLKSGEGNGNPLQESCLENPHGQKSLKDYSPSHNIPCTDCCKDRPFIQDYIYQHSIFTSSQQLGKSLHSLPGCQ